MKKVILTICDGCVSDYQIPDGITVEIRDYDCPEEWGGLIEDEDGDKYQEILLPEA